MIIKLKKKEKEIMSDSIPQFCIINSRRLNHPIVFIS